jgi:hypothetical protein
MATKLGLRGFKQRGVGSQPVRGVVSRLQLHHPPCQQQQRTLADPQRDRFRWIVWCSADISAGTQTAVEAAADPNNNSNGSKAAEEQQQWEAEIEETLKLVRLLPPSGKQDTRVVWHHPDMHSLKRHPSHQP